MAFNWTRISVFPSTNNSTHLYLLPDRLYKFRATSTNQLIGQGGSVVSAQYISTEVKGQ